MADWPHAGELAPPLKAAPLACYRSSHPLEDPHPKRWNALKRFSFQCKARQQPAAARAERPEPLVLSTDPSTYRPTRCGRMGSEFYVARASVFWRFRKLNH